MPKNQLQYQTIEVLNPFIREEEDNDCIDLASPNQLQDVKRDDVEMVDQKIEMIDEKMAEQKTNSMFSSKKNKNKMKDSSKPLSTKRKVEEENEDEPKNKKVHDNQPKNNKFFSEHSNTTNATIDESLLNRFF